MLGNILTILLIVIACMWIWSHISRETRENLKKNASTFTDGFKEGFKAGDDDDPEIKRDCK